jgi:hypothetical protein
MIGRDPDATEVKPIGIPTRGQRRFFGDVTVRVQAACLEQQVEAHVVQVHQRAAERPREFAASQAVFIVVKLVHAARVVEQREERHHLCVGAGRIG